MIFALVDKFNKYAHFLLVSHPFTTIDVAWVFMDNIYKLHGIPNNIIFDRKKLFLGNLWTELFKLMGTTLKIFFNPMRTLYPTKLSSCIKLL